MNLDSMSPEVIQLQQTPDLAPQPATAKRPRPPQFHLAQLDPNRSVRGASDNLRSYRDGLFKGWLLYK